MTEVALGPTRGTNVALRGSYPHLRRPYVAARNPPKLIVSGEYIIPPEHNWFWRIHWPRRN